MIGNAISASAISSVYSPCHCPISMSSGEISRVIGAAKVVYVRASARPTVSFRAGGKASSI